MDRATASTVLMLMAATAMTSMATQELRMDMATTTTEMYEWKALR